MEESLPSFAPSASWEVLRRRAELFASLRRFFDERGFLEVETPLLCRDSVVDVHLEPFVVPLLAEEGGLRYLQTSPEFAMKRMLAAGAEAIYQVTRAFRRGEQGRWHNPEFTMVEWYRVGDDLRAGMAHLAELADRLLGQVPREQSYAEAFRESVGIDPLEAPDEELSEAARVRGWNGSSHDERDDWLDFLFATVVVPSLRADVPILLYHYPASQAALARLAPDDARVAERFELFFRGVELANGYHELTDANEWRRRAESANERRRKRGRPPIPVESWLLEAMEQGLPPASGTALGFDRLVMTALGKESLAEVMAFPWDRA